ncbi:MAG: hypothetical protein ABEK50_15200, partial [bacterium]
MTEIDNARYTSDAVKTAIRKHIREVKLKNHGLYPVQDGRLNRLWTTSLNEIQQIRVIVLNRSQIYFGRAKFRIFERSQYSTMEVDFWLQPDREGK